MELTLEQHKCIDEFLGPIPYSKGKKEISLRLNGLQFTLTQNGYVANETLFILYVHIMLFDKYQIGLVTYGDGRTSLDVKNMILDEINEFVHKVSGHLNEYNIRKKSLGSMTDHSYE